MKTSNAERGISALKLCDIVKDYGSGDNVVHALKGVSLGFRKNEFVSVLGPSGCGKTTLLNIIGGLDRYTSGDLIIEGRSTKNFKDRDWDAYRNNSIGFVFQSYNLIPHQNVLANVEIALELSGVSKKERKARALSILEQVGLKGLEHKKPNQLSGGQMQRVAIARALVNDPEIILADEPTGALDTETSVQIMELLKKVSEDRLVIMVTHNPDLAERYSTRIIKLVDGLVVDDTDPFTENELPEPKEMRKPKMGLKTAFLLSLKNLISKRARTILTSIAGSIGIIGVALVLALSNGFSGYMSRMQTDTLSSYPLTISESSVDLSSFTELSAKDFKEKFPQFNNILVERAFEKLTGMLKMNYLRDTSENGFLHYLSRADKSLYYAISYDYGFDMNDYFYTDIGLKTKAADETVTDISGFYSIDYVVRYIEGKYESGLMAAMGLSTGFVRQYIPTIQEMPDRELIASQYDVLYGKLPDFDDESKKEIVLVVDEYNGVSDITLALIGLLDATIDEGAGTVKVDFESDTEGNTLTSIPIERAVGKKIYLAKNSLMYTKSGEDFVPNFNLSDTDDGLEELTVSGIIRVKKNTSGILKSGFAYSPKLTEYVINTNRTSEIVAKATQVFMTTGKPLAVKMPDELSITYEEMSLRDLAGVNTPSKVSIYAKDFNSKQKLKTYIDDWNAKYEENDPRIIYYNDIMSMMFGMLGTMVDAVTYILIAFTSISLVVSSVMIGIITYISVVERTKEIGVLRALGAAKYEISNVFNAETFLIGLFAGGIGVGVTYLITIPLNVVIGGLVENIGSIAVLNPLVALLLVAVSITLTLLAGLFPSRIAAKKDPVVALRTE